MVHSQIMAEFHGLHPVTNQPSGTRIRGSTSLVPKPATGPNLEPLPSTSGHHYPYPQNSSQHYPSISFSVSQVIVFQVNYPPNLCAFLVWAIQVKCLVHHNHLNFATLTTLFGFHLVFVKKLQKYLHKQLHGFFCWLILPSQVNITGLSSFLEWTINLILVPSPHELSIVGLTTKPTFV